MKQLNKLLKIAIWISVVLFAVRCWIEWEELITAFSLYDVYGYAGEAIGLASIITIVYEKWLWRWNPFVSMPKLKRKYKGSIISTYDGKARTARMEIKQTLLTVHVTLITKESRSNSINACIEEINGEAQLIYSYLNTSKAGVRERSPLHYGTAMLCLADVKKLSGLYYNDRQYTGDMQFTAEEK